MDAPDALPEAVLEHPLLDRLELLDLVALDDRVLPREHHDAVHEWNVVNK